MTPGLADPDIKQATLCKGMVMNTQLRIACNSE
jgi:hypothetical protein